MSWLASIGIGVLTAAFGAACALLAAIAAVEWLRVSSFEGAAGYFVVLIAFFGFIGGLVIGIVASRFLGGPGWPGFFLGLGWSALIVGGAIAVVTGFLWLTADREPLVAGRPLDLLVEVSVPAALQAEVERLESHHVPYVSLQHEGESGWIRYFDLAQGRMENGRWILSGRFGVFRDRSDRGLNVSMHAVETQFFDLPLPGRPDLMADWSDWLRSPYLSNRAPPPPEEAFAVRYRVVHRPEPDPAN
jgi:hypothetical protein